MRIYAESSEETLRARRLLRQWIGDGFLTKEQYQRMEQDTASDLRVTNIFLRLVLFLFTVIGVAAAVALFFPIVLSGPSQQTTGVVLLIFAALSYTAAEAAIAQARLYRHGIEEALVVCSVALLCAGLDFICFSVKPYFSREIQCAVPAVGALASLCIWHRFNLWYAFAAAMIFAIFLPGYWTPSHSAQRAFIAALYAAGLICIALIRSRRRFDSLRFDSLRLDCLDEAYSISEALLWLGLYLILNLKIAALGWPTHWWSSARPASEFAIPFYWTTWVLLWALPPLILARGVRRKDRLVLAVGSLTAVLTLVTNKPYLGWPRHTWDPMFLGIALIGVALLLRRWLATGAGGVRHGFTGARLSEKDKDGISASSAVLGLITSQSIAPAPQPTNPDFQFGGGGSGGGGASGDF